jgi:MFS family permease
VHPALLFAQTSTAPPLSLELRLPFSIMHFLQFAIWGAWFVVLGNYLNSLNFSRKDIGRIYATMALGSVIAPMFMGTIADRYLESELLMGISHLVGALLLFAMAQITTPRAFYWTALLYALVYSPTLILVNSIVFRHIPDAARDFPTIRVLGTIGWIAAGLSLRLLIRPGQPVNNRPLLLASALSVILGVFSLLTWVTPQYTLPPTPPSAAGSGAEAVAVVSDGKVVSVQVTKPGAGYRTAPALGVTGGGGKGATLKAQLTDQGTIGAIEVVEGGEGYTSAPTVEFPTAEIPFLRALRLLQSKTFAVFYGVSFFITLALSFYYSWTGVFLEKRVGVQSDNVGPLMTIGQWVEIFFMFTLPWFLQELGMKWVLALGMAAWGVRYAFFAAGGPLLLIILGIALHGVCFDFFFGAGFIYVEQTAPREIQASGQALFGVLTYGLGMWLGSEASGWLNQWLTVERPDPKTGKLERITDWTKFWLVPCIGVLIALAVFVVAF